MYLERVVSISIHLCLGFGLPLILKCRINHLKYDVFDGGDLPKENSLKKALEILLYCTFFNLIGALIVAFLFNQTTAFAHVDPKGFLATVAENKPNAAIKWFSLKVIANIFVNIAILSYLYFKDETAKVLLALSAIYMFVFMTNEHLAG